ncbi:NAD-dependent DNA ligase LigA [Acidimicrobiaceae bacterium]|nr:NAD-dependent DNA ligase LigA [Acidimicrobiaceae bacterium]
MNKKNVREIIDKLTNAEHAYYVLNDPIMSDGEYDKLFNSLKLIEQDHPELLMEDSPTQRVTETPSDAFEPVEHQRRMYSLDNIENSEDLKKWFERLEKITENSIFPVTVEPKIDGLAISLIYQDSLLKRGLTRGDGVVGEDVTHNVKTIRNIPLRLKKEIKGTVEIRGEVYMPVKSFDKLNDQRLKDSLEIEKLKLKDKNKLSDTEKKSLSRIRKEGTSTFINSRNAAAGSLRQKDASITSNRDLRLLAYQLIIYEKENKNNFHSKNNSLMNELGFETNKIDISHSQKDIEKSVELIKESRSKYSYQIDGAVLKVDSLQAQDELGYTSKSPRWAVAFKFPSEEQTTILKDIKLQTGRTGAITPVAVLEPIDVGGAKVSFATLHNPDEINRKDLRINDYVIVRRAGDVIPEVVSSLKDRRDGSQKKWELPKKCPCGEFSIELIDEEKVPRCEGGQSCNLAKKEAIIFFGSKSGLEIEGLGRETVETLLESKLINNVEDIYSLKYEDLIDLPSWEKKKTNNLLNAIKSSTNAPPEKLLTALGIRFIGKRTSQLLIQNFNSIDGVLNAKESDIESIHGISISVSKSLEDWKSNKENINLLNQLKNYGFAFKKDIKTSKSYLSGNTFVITGTLDNYSRQDVVDILESYGGTVTTSVSKNTDYLIYGSKPGSKFEKAKTLGVQTLDETNFKELISKYKKSS